jgi:hypothetical protein
MGTHEHALISDDLDSVALAGEKEQQTSHQYEDNYD